MENILLNIDTRFRDTVKYPNSGKFTYTLKEPLKNISYIRLSSIELPITFYTFSQTYNNVSFIIVLMNNTTIPVTIKDGNYTSDNMINYIQGLFNTINAEYSTNLRISWDNINYLVTISNSQPFTLICNNENSTYFSLGYRLGYRKTNLDYLAQNIPNYGNPNVTVFSWVSDFFLNITKDEYIFLKVNDYGVIYNDIREKSLLSKLIVYDSQFVIDNGSNFLTKMYKFRQPTNISRLDIELIFPFGQTVDMNHIDYSLTLEFGQIYDNQIIDNYNFKLLPNKEEDDDN